ncbi:MAG: FAD-dependent oxidoreductase [Hymenobacter sp.]
MRVGGRVRTDVTPEGFRLDRGFQILLTNYPEARRMFDYGALNLQAFRSGARYSAGRRAGNGARKPAARAADGFCRRWLRPSVQLKTNS